MEQTLTYSETANAAGMGAMLSIMMIISLIVAVLSLVCMWKIFVKAGYEGWKAIIPFYNTYLLFEMTWGNGWLMLTMFLSIIPIIGSIAVLVILVMTYYKLSLHFGKGAGFTVGLLLVPIVFLPLLAFGDAEYTA